MSSRAAPIFFIMPSPALTTRLDAVNTILTSCGEQPVSVLSNTTADAANAAALLDEVSREVQAEGWHFNTEKDVPLTPDSSKLINLPDNAIKVDVDPFAYPAIDPVQRGTKLYDRAARSYEFSSPIKAEVVYALPFEELPEQARRYIATKAARVFYARFVGETGGVSFTAQDEAAARASLVKSNLANADINFFRSNPLLAWRLRR